VRGKIPVVALALLAGASLTSLGLLQAVHQSPEDAAADILKATGITGGLIVHLGCGDGRLTAALHASDSFLVHGLDRDPANVQRARKYIASRGLYGNVSVDRLTGSALPYADNLVRLLVVQDPSGIPRSEIRRVLAPGGVAYVRRGRGWAKRTKRWPDEIDEWTHYLHDATNNAVAHDTVVGPPRHQQWIGSPRWARHHDHMASTSAMVSAGGRLFYIFDEAPTCSVVLPSNWALIARDAFNGVILWKRPIPDWWPQLYPLKSGPTVLTRRLVAGHERVYVTLGLNAPVSALDAATGKTLWTRRETKATEEIICSGGTLFVVVNPEDGIGIDYKNIDDIYRYARQWAWQPQPRLIMALDVRTGKILWRAQSPVAPTTLAADDKRVYFHDGEKVVALDRASGQRLWASEPVPRWSTIRTWFAPTLVVYKGVVLFAGGENMIPHRGGKDTVTGISAETGKILWRAEHPPCGYQSPEDLLVAGGLIWAGETTSGGYSGRMIGIDPFTGQIKVEFLPDVKSYWFHHRCYRGKATDNYVLTSRTGIEFIDFRRQHWEIHHWVRGGCLYGVMPCNGMVYTPPHDCACYIEAKQFGFNALAPASPSRRAPREVPDEGRLERGPAYDQPIEASEPKPDDWPTYRHDNTRSGFTQASVSPNLKQTWRRKIGGKLTSLVAADGKLFVASVDTHTLYALDQSTGRILWSYIAGGRIDSPPTFWQGRVFFGCADGWVYCLRASDGQLIWRFRAAPLDRRIVAFEQVESVWPVHGSVLIQDGVLYCVAGRSMFLDGGLRFLRLDPKTGRKLSETILDDRDHESGENLQKYVSGLNMTVALPDVLSSDGRYVYMRSMPFSLDGKRQRIAYLDVRDQRGEDVHLFSPTGFLDDAWFHRTYWIWGRSMASGAGGYYLAGRYAPAGRILVIGPENVYGFGRKPQYYRWTTPLGYHLFSTSKEIPVFDKAMRRSSGSCVAVEKSPSLNPAGKPLTVEAWAFSKDGVGVVVARGGPSHGYSIFLRKGRPCFAIRVKDKLEQVCADIKLARRWVHLAGVLTPDKKLLLYVDGRLVASKTSSGFIASDPYQAMEIGADEQGGVGQYSSPFGFKGAIDEVRVYHRALSADEIRQHFQAPDQVPAKDDTLVLYFSFDGGKATDLSGKGNNGTIYGARVVKGRVGDALAFKGVRQTGGPYLVKHKWSRSIPMLVRAMTLAGRTLFIAGPPDVVDEHQAVRNLADPQIQRALADQVAAWYGEKGGLLWAVNPATGETVAEYELDSPPVFDSLIASASRLYLATMSGEVVCLAGAR